MLVALQSRLLTLRLVEGRATQVFTVSIMNGRERSQRTILACNSKIVLYVQSVGAYAQVNASQYQLKQGFLIVGNNVAFTRAIREHSEHSETW